MRDIVKKLKKKFREVPRNESMDFLRSGTLGGTTLSLESCSFAIDKESKQSLDTAESLNLWLTKFALHCITFCWLVSFLALSLI